MALPTTLARELWPDAARILAIELWAGERPASPEVLAGTFDALIREIRFRRWGVAHAEAPIGISAPKDKWKIDHDLLDYTAWTFNSLAWAAPQYAAPILRSQELYPNFDAPKAHLGIYTWMMDQYVAAGHQLTDGHRNALRMMARS